MPDASHPRAPGQGAWPVVWRYGLAIAWWLLAAGLSIYLSATGPKPPWPLVSVDLTIGAIAIWGMRFRHRWPRGLAVVVTLITVVSSSSFVAALWALARLATRRRWQEIVGFGTFVVAYATATSQLDFTGLAAKSDPLSLRELLIGIAGSAVIVALVSAIGSYVGARRDLLRALHDRAEEAERRQETRVLQGQAEERNRIAREMHDVLAHRISLVSMHAGVLAYRDDLPPEQVREVAGVIQENARQSMTELRAILGSLRQDEERGAGQPEAPQPGFDEVGALISDARRAGQRLDVTQEIQHPELMPTLVGRHVYRVVQELVTNARKHAPGTKVCLELIGAPGEGVRIASRNPLQLGEAELPGAGVGLIGLRERASVLGGTMHSGVNAEGQFEVKVWFPW